MKFFKSLYGILLIMAATLLYGCYYDEVVPFNELPQNVSFKNDVVPILNLNCNSTGCHDAAPAHNPSLVADKAYDALLNGNYVNSVVPESSPFYKEISAGNMPPSGELSSIDQKIILAWITEGAQDN